MSILKIDKKLSLKAMQAPRLPRSSLSKKRAYSTSLEKGDVIFHCRPSRAFSNHPGNKAFFFLIKMNRKANPRCGSQRFKHCLALSIVKAISGQPGGRFLLYNEDHKLVEFEKEVAVAVTKRALEISNS